MCACPVLVSDPVIVEMGPNLGNQYFFLKFVMKRRYEQMKFIFTSWKVEMLFAVVVFSLLFGFAGRCSAENSNIQRYLNRLASNRIEVKILAAKEITTSGITDPELFDVIEKQLLQNYNSADLSKDEIGLMAWFCKDLASSGLNKYVATLERVANNHTNMKLSYYAEQSLILLISYDERNKNLSRAENIKLLEFDDQNVKIMMLLKSDEIKDRIYASKMVTKSMAFDNKIYDEIEFQLLKNYKFKNQDEDSTDLISYHNNDVQVSRVSYFVDLMSWYCKALSSSGQLRYKPAVERVLLNTNSYKLKKYAKQSLSYFALNAKKRKSVVQYSKTGIDQDNASIIIDLRSNYVITKIQACKRLLTLEKINPEVYKVVEQELLFGLSQQPVEENYADMYQVNTNQQKWSASPEGDRWSLYELFYPETMSMMCKVLSISGDVAYKPTLEEVIQSTNDEKIRGYAKKSYEKLERIE